METGIYLFCGPTGTGKTANMVAAAVQEMINLERFYFSNKQIESLNKNGYRYKKLPESHVVYSNLNITANVPGGGFKRAYALNPYKMALPNNKIPFDLYYPACVQAITEVQIYLPSYEGKKIDLEKYGYYQNHRHFYELLLLDTQFVFNLAKPVRDLVKTFSRCLKIEQKFNASGKAIKTIFHNLEFSTADSVEDFEKTKTGKYELDKKCSSALFVKKEYDFDVFACYSSWSNFYYYLPKDKTEIVEVFHIENAPEGFFDNPDIRKVG